MECDALSYTLDEGLTAVGFGKSQVLLFIYAGVGWLTEAMEVMILSFIGPAVKSEWELSLSEEGLITSVVFAGMLIGASTWGLVSDNFGRRNGFFFLTVTTGAVGLLSAFSPSYIVLIIFRFLVGVGVGGGHVFLSWFLEFIPASQRGIWMVFFSVFWSLGIIFEALLAWIVMPRLNWRWLLAFSAMPSFVLLLFYGLAPESPRYLCVKGKTTDAHIILEKMASLNQTTLPHGELAFNGLNDVDEESNPSEDTPLLSTARSKLSKFSSSFSSFFMLFSSKLIRTTLLLCMLFFGNTFSYYGIILLTSELTSSQSECGFTNLPSKYLQDSNGYLNVLITSCAELPGILLAALLVDRLGRKLTMAFMFSVAFVFLLALLFRQSSTVTTALLFGARMVSEGGFAVTLIYAPELYPTSVRATGAGVANAMGRIGGVVCPLVAVGLVNGCRYERAIILFQVVIAVTVLCIFLFPFDTKGRELSDSLDVSKSKEPFNVGN